MQAVYAFFCFDLQLFKYINFSGPFFLLNLESQFLINPFTCQVNFCFWELYNFWLAFPENLFFFSFFFFGDNIMYLIVFFILIVWFVGHMIFE